MTADEGGRVAPFGNPRINARCQLPAAYRRLLRPSSPPDAKASVVRPYTLSKKFSSLRQPFRIVDLVIRVVILFNFQLPIFKERGSAPKGERVHSISLLPCSAQGGK